MSSRRFPTWLLCCFVALFTASCEYEEVEQIIGYRGPARTNPFLAAQRFLGEMGYDVETRNRMDSLPSIDGVLITQPQSLLNYGDADRLLAWVKNGGHLMLLLSGAETWRNDHREFTFQDLFKGLIKEAEGEKFLKTLELTEVQAGAKELQEATINKHSFSADLQGTFTYKGKPDVLFGKPESPSLVSFNYHGGRVTVIANASPFRNRWIGEKDHAALLSALVALEGHEAVYFLNGVRVSFLSMVWEHGWMIILTVAVLLIAWLWKNFPRFGPVLKPANTDSREFSEHLRLTGRYLWDQKQIWPLISPLREQVLRAAERLGWRFSDPDFFEKLAARTDVPVERARLALASGTLRDPQLFIRAVKDLQRMRETF
jgi:hypothetical protein